jgi:hypothetical protein
MMISWAPFPNPLINKARYMIIFVDDFSRYTWTFFLMKKSEVCQHLKDFKSLVRDVLLENTLKRNYTKERLIRPPLLWI